jgi:hypothetical protein
MALSNRCMQAWQRAFARSSLISLALKRSLPRLARRRLSSAVSAWRCLSVRGTLLRRFGAKSECQCQTWWFPTDYLHKIWDTRRPLLLSGRGWVRQEAVGARPPQSRSEPLAAPAVKGKRDRSLLRPAIVGWAESRAALALQRARLRKTLKRAVLQCVHEWQRLALRGRIVKRSRVRFECRLANRVLRVWFDHAAAQSGGGGDDGEGRAVLAARVWGAWAMMCFHRF